MSLTTRCASRPGPFLAPSDCLPCSVGLDFDTCFLDDFEVERTDMINGDGEVIQWSTGWAKGTPAVGFGNPQRVLEPLNDAEELRMLGDHLMVIEAYPQAAKAYHKAISKGADVIIAAGAGPIAGAHLYARMASALLSDDLFIEARPFASDAFSLAERDPYVRYVHAHTLHAGGSDGEALDTLDELALAIDFQPFVNVARAEFDPESVNLSVLRGILANAVSKQPMSGALHARLSVVSDATGHQIDALTHSRIAAWLQPSLLRRWRRYGEAAMRANSYTEAAEAFESAREISPFDPRLDALVARAHLVGGDVDQAAASVLRGLRKDGAQRDCLTILAQLQTNSPTSVTTSALGLEIDHEAVEQKELFIYVPPWTHGTHSA